MQLLVEGSPLRGEVEIPGSKSHTIRGVAISALAAGTSTLRRPLHSADAEAALRAYTALGAGVERNEDAWTVTGTGGVPAVPDNVIDLGNSGTTMNVALGTAALLREGLCVLTGDAQVRRRPNGPLADALNALGARVQATRGNGCPPFVAGGWLRGGTVSFEAMTSQYVTALLLNAPLADGDTLLDVPLMHEKPYVWMTLDWLARQGIRVVHDDSLTRFEIPGGQAYTPVDRQIPADFSSATFFLAAGALQDNDIVSRGLDLDDTQGDKAVLDYLRAMGADVSDTPDGIRVCGKVLQGTELDLNATPDALPMLAVLGCFARGTTRLANVPQARLKETDRIVVMAAQLGKLGARVREEADGLVIEQSALQPGHVDGHGDHRVVMSLAIGATMLPGTTTIEGYEAVNVTYPGFVEALRALGATARVVP